MSLSMLVGGADCGPSNALQGLSKQFDRDRGLQQDHFGPARAGSSKEGFRSQYNTNASADQDAARFFANANGQLSSPSPLAGPSAYDLSALHTTLPAFHAVPSAVQTPPVLSPASAPAAAWASDFLQQSPVTQKPLLQQEHAAHQQLSPVGAQAPSPGLGSGVMQWTPGPLSFANRMNSMAFQPYAVPQQTQQVQPAAQAVDETKWNEAFMTHEQNVAPENTLVAEQEDVRPKAAEDPDELARAAGQVIDAVRHEQNPKFQNSQFFGLMKQLRDREVVVEGGKMIPKEEASGWATEFQSSVDVKGKGKAVDVSGTAMRASGPSFAPVGAMAMQGMNVSANSTSAVQSTAADEVDAYFKQDNEEYIDYWNGASSAQPAQQQNGVSVAGLPQGAQMNAEWGALQRDWERFEATATGLRQVANYQFQQKNPYLLGEASTRHHLAHSELGSLLEGVLEMEATVQRDPSNASAWFELGVKQQENEREQKAIQALRRALELDATHLPSWLALAVSYTNDGNRIGAYEAVQEWIERNAGYRDAVRAFRASSVLAEDATQAERFDHLIECLIAMARSSTGGEIDADIQVALAILMNTNEAYDKATDCFRTALAVRPEDWQLYNRVGATLANSGQPEEALQYYYRALELNPAYIRARFNLGISCINLRRYQEASQHILDALVLQDADNVREPDGTQDKRGVVSSALWDSLKTCCLHMQRIDLATICDRQDLDAFRLNYQMQ